MRTLVALLGHAPGTVTAAFYALQTQGYGLMDRIITVTTHSGKADDCEQMIAAELDQWQSASGHRIVYKPERIAAADLEDQPSTQEFQDKIAKVLEQERAIRDNKVYLSLAGGRKSMAALAAVAAQLHGADLMFHLYVTDELERQGDVDNLLISSRWRERCLRPNPDEYTLAPVPFFQVGVSQGELRLILQGRLNEFAYGYIKQHPEFWNIFRDETKEHYMAYHFEVKTATYLESEKAGTHQYERARHHYTFPGRGDIGDLDVYAERTRAGKREILLCECKLYRREDAGLETRKVVQLRDKLRKIQQGQVVEGQPHIEAWVVSNAAQAEEEAKRLAKGTDGEVEIKLMHATLPGNWRNSVDWEIQSIQEMET